MWNPSTCNTECDKTCEICEYQNIETFACKERVIDYLVLKGEDEMLNTTKASPVVDTRDNTGQKIKTQCHISTRLL